MTVEMAAVMAMIRTGDHLGVRKYLRDGGDPNARNHMGYTLLHVACMEGKEKVVDILLEEGASVNSCTIDQTTPLHRAASHGHKNVTEILLNKNAYINAQDKKGDTPLHMAAQGLQTAVTKLLLARKADKTRENLKKQIFTDMVGQQMMAVIERDDTDTLLPWIEWGVSPNCRGAMNWSMLHHAAARGQLNCASIIIERKGDVNILDSNSATPLHTASFHGNIKLVKFLITSGANVNAQDQSGKTPLLSAVSGSSHESINVLLEKGGDPDIPDNEGHHFTHLVNEFLVRAVTNSNVNQVHGVLRGRADPDVRDISGLPVLCYAAFKGSLMIADALLEYGADANIKDEAYGKTPLHWAAYWGQLFILKALLDRGASVKVKDKYGRTPLHEGAQEGHKDIVTVLSARFAPLNDQDNEGNTPLHLAAKWGKCTQVEQLLENGAMELQNNIGLLYSDLSLIRAVRTGDKAAVISGLAWGGNSNTKDEKGCTLLHHAILKDMDDIVELLLKNGADVNIQDKHGRNALLIAAYRGNHKVMEGLTNAGGNVNAKDWKGSTPLHWAANEGTIDTVQFLLKHNADMTIKNNKGELYTDLLLKHLYFAVRRNDLESVIKMLEAGADQHAIVYGTDLTPKEEACRREHWPVLQHMVKVGPPREPKPEDPNTMLALQDIRRLFKDPDSSEEDSGEEDESDAYWKMSNAERIHSYTEVFQDEDGENIWSAWQEKPISAKDLFKEETAAFWKDLEEDLKQRLEEEKRNAISAQEFFKEDKPWWERKNEDDDDDEEDNEDGSEEADDEDDESEDEYQRQQLKENSITAKDLFKEEHPFFKEEIISKEEIMKNDAPWFKNDEDTKENDRIISKEEIMTTNICWWENNDNNNDEKCLKNNDENIEKVPKIISKEQVMKQDMPWWKNKEESEKENEMKNEDVNGITIPKDEIMKAESPWWIQNKGVDVITKEEFNKEDNQNWWETHNESEEAEHQLCHKMKLEKGIPAKEFFKEVHPWFAKADEKEINEKTKGISLQEFLKDENSSWWDARNSPPKDESVVGNLKKSSLDVLYNNIPEVNGENTAISNNLENNALVNKINSAKDFFKEDERPWWYTENSNNSIKIPNDEVKEENSEDNEDQSAEDTTSKDEESSSEDEDDKSADDDKPIENNEDKSVDDDIEESRTDTWEDANDSVFSETSTMYSTSDGHQRSSQPWWEEKKAWWEESSVSTDSTPIQDIENCEISGENPANPATYDDTNIETNTTTHASEHQSLYKHKPHINTEVTQTNIDEMQSQELEIHSEDEIDDICDEEVEEPESDSGCISTTFEPISLTNKGENEGLVEKLNAKIILETVRENNEIQTEITPKTNFNLQSNNNEDNSKDEQNKVTDARGIESLQELTGKVVTEMVSKDPILEKNDNIDVDVTNSDPYLLLSLDPSKLLEMGLQKSDSQTSGYESSLSLSTTDTNKSNNKNINNITINNIKVSNVDTPLTQEISSSKRENPKSHPTLIVTHETPEIKTQEGTTKLSVHLHDPQPSATHMSPQADIDDVKAFVADYGHKVSDAAKLAEKLVEQMESIINTKLENNESIDSLNINSINDQMINKEYKESLQEPSPEVLNEHVITGDKVINKMDDCLAKVDASLAWIDAKITKKNNDTKMISNPKENFHEYLDKPIIAPQTKIIQNVSNQESPDKKGKLLDPVNISKEASMTDTNCELLTPKSDDEEFVFHDEVPVQTFQSPRLPRKIENIEIQSNNSQCDPKSLNKITNELSKQEVNNMNTLEINSESLSPKSDNEEFIFHEVIPVRTFQSPRLPRKRDHIEAQSNTSDICASSSKSLDETSLHLPVHIVKLSPLTEMSTPTEADNKKFSTVSKYTLDSIPKILEEKHQLSDNKTNFKEESVDAFDKISEEENINKMEQVVHQETKKVSERLENIQNTSMDTQKINDQFFQKAKKDTISIDENNKIEDNILKYKDSKVSSLKTESKNINEKKNSKIDNSKKMPEVTESKLKANLPIQTENNQFGEELSSNTNKYKNSSLENIDKITPEDESSKQGSLESLNSIPVTLSQQLRIPDKTLWRCSTYDTMSLSDYDNMVYSFGKQSSLTLSDSEESLKGSRISLIDPISQGSQQPQHKEGISVNTPLHMDETVSQNCSDVSQSPTSKVCHKSVDNLCTDPVVEVVGGGSKRVKESDINDENSILRDSFTKSDYGPSQKNSDSFCESSVRKKIPSKNKNKDQNKDLADLQESKHKDINLDKGTGTVPKQENKSFDEVQTSSSQATTDLDKSHNLVIDQKKVSQSPPTNKNSSSQNSEPPVVPQRTRGNKESSQKLNRDVDDKYTLHSQNAQNQHTNTPLLYNPDKSEDVKVGQLPPRSGEPQSSRGSTRNEKQDKQNSKEVSQIEAPLANFFPFASAIVLMQNFAFIYFIIIPVCKLIKSLFL
ncbi:unnamed protein product [Meganyctiphanes norvegica]|uniref:Uncharacterized protein n=1 Tax=Meganyctiphanes norvegica TaxID=48144 RepID=A0AAV2R3G7_MEGNR